MPSSVLDSITIYTACPKMQSFTSSVMGGMMTEKEQIITLIMWEFFLKYMKDVYKIHSYLQDFTLIFPLVLIQAAWESSLWCLEGKCWCSCKPGLDTSDCLLRGLRVGYYQTRRSNPATGKTLGSRGHLLVRSQCWASFWIDQPTCVNICAGNGIPGDSGPATGWTGCLRQAAEGISIFPVTGFHPDHQEKGRGRNCWCSFVCNFLCTYVLTRTCVSWE